MRITRISTFPVHIPLKPIRRMISSLGQHIVSDYVLVRIETDAGIDGVGEATVMPRWSGETVWSGQAIIDHVFAPLLLDQDPADIEQIDGILDAAAQGNWFAKSAIEMACWDIVGKDAGLPVYELLGGPCRSRDIKCRFSMGAYPPERVQNTVPDLIDNGFDTIKVKVGTNIDEDVERVRLVREIIGPDREIVIDANCGNSAPDAIQAAAAMDPLRVSLFEQPTPRDDYEALAEVRENVSMPVMADDIVFDFNQAVECVRHGRLRCDQYLPRQERRDSQIEGDRGLCGTARSRLQHRLKPGTGRGERGDVSPCGLGCRTCRSINSPATYWGLSIMRYPWQRTRWRSRGR